MDKFTKLSETYKHNETGITVEKKDDRVTIYNMRGKLEFIFKNSSKEAIEKIGQALLDIAQL